VSGPEQTDSDAMDADLGWESQPPARASIADRLAGDNAVLEVGIGRRPGVARTLAHRNVDVRVVDVHDRSVPDSVEFVRDDIVDRARRLEEAGQSADDVLTAAYRVDAIYGLNLPPELQRPGLQIARAVDAAFLFTTLGGDPATVPTRRESIGRDTLYIARDR
jgi:uncharacterized UPF0146 family protein